MSHIVSLPRSGSQNYNDWSFSWNVGSKKEGLELFNVRYKGIKVLYKASMPVVRVKYRGRERNVRSGCGPYEDRLKWGNMKIITGATKKVIARFFTGMMELAVYAKIGGYHLYQAWYFHRDGRLQPMLYSKGWSCGENPKRRRDHRHHPYWRLDFDIEQAGNNQIREFRRPIGSATYTQRLYRMERNTFRSDSNADLFWTVGREGSELHATIRYANNERRDFGGTPWFNFCTKDAAARLYKSSEDVGWRFGALGHLGFASPQENIDRRDVVFWAVGHMTHIWTREDQQDPHWHSSGPVIRAMW
jgi:hypothetical protein